MIEDGYDYLSLSPLNLAKNCLQEIIDPAKDVDDANYNLNMVTIYDYLFRLKVLLEDRL